MNDTKAARVAEALGYPRFVTYDNGMELHSDGSKSALPNEAADRISALLDERDALQEKLAPVGTTRPHSHDHDGCSSHACLIKKPQQGTNSGKCFCSQAVVRSYIDALRAELAESKAEVGGVLFDERESAESFAALGDDVKVQRGLFVPLEGE